MTHTPRVALITGSARRIGAAIARHLHGAGFDLALHYRGSGEAMQALAAELENARAGSVLVLQADLDDPGSWQALVDAAVARFGHLDALINNASSFEPTPVGATTLAQWESLLSSNARAPFFLAQAAAPHLRATHGAIVNLVDIHAQRPLAKHSVYCMAKAALVMATRSLAVELAPEVRVNAIAPGAILWAEGDLPSQAQQQSILARTPLGRTGTPNEVAEAVRWLVQDASYTTGQVIAIDGGRSLSE